VAGLILLCRPGFEPEAAAEAVYLGRTRGAAVRAKPADGYVVIEAGDATGAETLAGIGSADLVFARQAFWARETVALPPSGDRAGVLVAAAAQLAENGGAAPFSDLFVEAPDTEAGRRLWPICTRLREAVEAGLKELALLGRGGGPRLHVLLTDREGATLGTADPSRSSPWPMGIPRLRLPRGAPSRSALKLEEALLVFLSETERRERLRAGRRAVDLGAAPGGWTWQLVQRGLVVTAVDNGPMDRALLDSDLVEHVRADGFTWRPERPIHWLVCDMVTAPARAAKLVGLWAARGLCREAVFNLKLPSGRRGESVRRCAGVIDRELGRRGVGYSLRFKHLYHDREEVTGHLLVAASAPAASPEPGRRARVRRPAAPAPDGGRRGRGRAGRAPTKGHRRR